MFKTSLYTFSVSTRTLTMALATSAMLMLPLMATADTELIERPPGNIEIELPVIDYDPDKFITEANLVMTAVSKKDVTPEPSGFVMNPGLNDAWYNPVTDGQGFFITVFPDLNLVNLAWFTYDTELPADESAANLGSAGHRWLTALGTIDGDSAVLNIDFASGGLFDTATVVEHTDPPGSEGTITLTFADCNSGLIEYDIPSIERQGSVPIQRVANDNIALCEALSGQ